MRFPVAVLLLLALGACAANVPVCQVEDPRYREIFDSCMWRQSEFAHLMLAGTTIERCEKEANAKGFYSRNPRRPCIAPENAHRYPHLRAGG